MASERPPRGSPAWKLSVLGDRFCRMGRFDAAVTAYERSLELAPRYAEAHNSLGAAHHRAGRIESALAAYRRTLEIDPGNALALSNLGAIHMERNQTDAAIAAYERALAVGEQAMIRVNLAYAQMLRGQLLAGWRNYEHRWTAGFRIKRARPATPPWLGQSSLAGRSILLCSEQGLGDMMQFVRYAPQVARLGAKVHLEAEPPLRALFAASFPELVAVYGVGDPILPCDEHCTVPSLPLAFATELDTVPAAVPYLRAPADAAARWTNFAAEAGRPRIGLAWSGNPEHHNDANRSIPFERFRRLLAGQDFRFVSVQKEVRKSDAGALAATPAVANLSNRIADFGDTAALMGRLDLIICVDTSVAHLAGALGKPVWVLLPFAPDWRWMLDRPDSPWYPTMRLFRQPRPGDWEAVFAQVRESLRERFP